MTDTCSSVSKLLEKYFDQEATVEERSLVEEHLPRCPICSEALRSMENLRDLIKLPVEDAVQKEDFQRVWENIRKGIRPKERSAWWETLLPRVDLSDLFRRKVWIPAAAAIAIFILITGLLLFRKTSSPQGLSVVEYVESPDYNVMVYQSDKSKVTVIWLFEGSGKGASTS